MTVDDAHRGRITRDGIRIHDKADFAGMRKAGALAARILDDIAPHVFPGQTTRRSTASSRTGSRRRARPRPRGLQGLQARELHFGQQRGLPRHSRAPIPKSSVETISKDPEKRRADDVLIEGDILNIDVTVIVDGWYGDSSRMYAAGTLSRKAERLIQVTHDALMKGIEAVRPGNTFGDIGTAIQKFVEAERMSSCATSAGTGWAACSTRRRTSCTMAGRARARCSRKACSSPSSRW
jgi:methionyl aminopeptidase